MSKSIILYDAGCYLCRQSKKWIQILDFFKFFQWETIQNAGSTEWEKDVNLNEENLSKEIHLITPDGKILRGFYSLRYVLIRTPLTFIAGLFMYIPGSGLVGVPVYKWIARNRYRIFKNRCKNGSCSIS
ncbi:thiol-disulfide oxidoreductase DCC family protein [Halobacillus sp. Marseille-P3879]|uniref:thiol-disulfide oxidoreductase DCC family protein n=1 Tax=Halobacillus TaxID=45667 RepID=UPI00135A1D9F|nr:DUF393 domain-containing protein [Halobacillus sp. Marseille-P3879]